MLNPPTVLLSELRDGVLCLTLNRPKVNAFDSALTRALHVAFQQAEQEAQVRCVLLSGAGEYFSVGQDLTDFNPDLKDPYRSHLQRTFNPLILQIRRLEKPVLAALNGPVSGAALGIALACDLRIASDRVRFVAGFTSIGLAPDSGVSLLLPVLIGPSRATEFIVTNTAIGAEQALAWGLVNRVVSADSLADEAFAWAAQLAQGPLRAMGLAKRAFNHAVLGNLEQTLDYEAHLQEIAGGSPEHAEGMRAFLEKRPARFFSPPSDPDQTPR